MSSRQNALVKRFRALAQDRRAERDRVLLDGEHLVDEALRANLTLDAVAFSEDAVAGRLAPLAERVERRAARIVAAPAAVFDALSPVRSPSGVVAIAELRAATLDAALAGRPQLVLVLAGVQDPGNVGAVIRTAEACGATAVIADAQSAHPFGWKALRAAMGSAFRLPVVVDADVADVIARLKAADVMVQATVARDGTPLPTVDLRQATAIVLGGEGAGIPDDLLAMTDGRITIPMAPSVESLNVAIAAALVLYEASRQRTDVAV